MDKSLVTNNTEIFLVTYGTPLVIGGRIQGDLGFLADT